MVSLLLAQFVAAGLASGVVDVTLPGFGDAVAWVPASKAPRPIVVAVHGNNDRPEWPCWRWSRIVGDRAFVLCPRGVPRKDDPSRFTFAGSAALEKEIEAGVAALVATYGNRVDTSGRVYAGHSLGANLAPFVLTKSPVWKTVVLSEGGAAQFAPWVAQTFAKKGGKRVLFACGQLACVNAANHAVATSKPLEGRVAYGKGGGHHFYGPVADAIEDAFDWLVAGDARFSP